LVRLIRQHKYLFHYNDHLRTVSLPLTQIKLLHNFISAWDGPHCNHFCDENCNTWAQTHSTSKKQLCMCFISQLTKWKAENDCAREWRSKRAESSPRRRSTHHDTRNRTLSVLHALSFKFFLTRRIL
jgi:hypothetical protein